MFIQLLVLQDRILKHRYLSLDDMEVDFTLLCDNARVYNLEGSQIHQDATALEVRDVDWCLGLVRLRALGEDHSTWMHMDSFSLLCVCTCV